MKKAYVLMSLTGLLFLYAAAAAGEAAARKAAELEKRVADDLERLITAGA